MAKAKKDIDKRYLNHDWHEGEILYSIFYTPRCGIPKCVSRVSVVKVIKYGDEINLWVRYCRKEFRKYWEEKRHFALYPTVPCTSKNIFLTKKEAETEFEQKKTDFILNQKEATYRSMLQELNRLDKVKNEIFGLMRMKIMKEDATQE